MNRQGIIIHEATHFEGVLARIYSILDILAYHAARRGQKRRLDNHYYIISNLAISRILGTMLFIVLLTYHSFYPLFCYGHIHNAPINNWGLGLGSIPNQQ
ncbi:hypothetical protein ACJX0J_027599 [Zea mays]